MTELRVFAENAREPDEILTEADAIADRLRAIGAWFERVSLPSANLDREANQDEVIEAYREPLDALMQRFGFAAVDVISLWPRHPECEELRERYACEHWHRGAEGRLFVDGRGVMCLRARRRVFALLCRRGDYVGLPAGTCHWLDAGNPPDFRAIRLFAAAHGWDGLPTGRDVSAHSAAAGQSGAVTA